MKFSAVTKVFFACAGLTAINPMASAQAPDPANIFVAKLLSGEASDAKALIAGLVGLSAKAPAFAGKDAVDSTVFIEAIGNCRIQSIRNTAPISIEYEIAPEFEIVWDCKGRGLKARITASGQWVTASDFGQVLFVPPPPKSETQDGRQ